MTGKVIIELDTTDSLSSEVRALNGSRGEALCASRQAVGWLVTVDLGSPIPGSPLGHSRFVCFVDNPNESERGTIIEGNITSLPQYP